MKFHQSLLAVIANIIYEFFMKLVIMWRDFVIESKWIVFHLNILVCQRESEWMKLGNETWEWNQSKFELFFVMLEVRGAFQHTKFP